MKNNLCTLVYRFVHGWTITILISFIVHSMTKLVIGSAQQQMVSLVLLQSFWLLSPYKAPQIHLSAKSPRLVQLPRSHVCSGFKVVPVAPLKPQCAACAPFKWGLQEATFIVVAFILENQISADSPAVLIAHLVTVRPWSLELDEVTLTVHIRSHLCTS